MSDDTKITADLADRRAVARLMQAVIDGAGGPVAAAFAWGVPTDHARRWRHGAGWVAAQRMADRLATIGWRITVTAERVGGGE